MNKEQPTGTEKTQNGMAKRSVCLRRRRRPRCSLAWTTTMAMAMATIYRHCIYLFYRLWLRFAVRNIIDGNVFYAEYKTQIIIIIKSRTRDAHMRQPHGSVYNSHFFSFHRWCQATRTHSSCIGYKCDVCISVSLCTFASSLSLLHPMRSPSLEKAPSKGYTHLAHKRIAAKILAF